MSQATKNLSCLPMDFCMFIQYCTCSVLIPTMRMLAISLLRNIFSSISMPLRNSPQPLLCLEEKSKLIELREWVQRVMINGVLKCRAPTVFFSVWECAGLPASMCDVTHKVLPSSEDHLNHKHFKTSHNMYNDSY